MMLGKIIFRTFVLNGMPYSYQEQLQEYDSENHLMPKICDIPDTWVGRSLNKVKNLINIWESKRCAPRQMSVWKFHFRNVPTPAGTHRTGGGWLGVGQLSPNSQPTQQDACSKETRVDQKKTNEDDPSKGRQLFLRNLCIVKGYNFIIV